MAGAEKHLLTLLPGLAEAGFEICLIVLAEPSRPMGGMVRRMQALGLRAEEQCIRADLDPVLLLRLAARIRACSPAIVHTHLVHADLHGNTAARLAGTPITVSTRHDQLAFRRRWWMRRLSRHLWRHTSAGICPSQALASFCLRIEGAPRERLVTIPHGIAFQAHSRERARASLGLPPDALAVAMVGRLVPEKGVDLGLDAFAAVAPQHPAACLVIIGDGPQRSTLEKRARESGVPGRIRWLGWRPDVDRLLPGLDLLMMPSRSEGFGLILVEAMGHGVPVLATASGSIPEIVTDRRQGVLVAPDQAGALGTALAGLLKDAAARAVYGAQARARAHDQFEAGRMIAETAALYRRLLERTG
jgi:glycosyltransferase involved in cell wall biosynthesis